MNKLWNFYLDRLQGHPTPCKMAESGEAAIDAKIGKYFKDKDAPLLILGCADGSEITFFKNLGFTNVFGITLDRSSESVEGAYIADMHDLSRFPVEHYKYIYANHSFEHAFAPMIVCLEIWTLMQPNGLWYINYPANIVTGRSTLSDPLTNTTSHHHPNLLTPSAATILFEITGFDVVDRTFSGEETFILKKIPMKNLSKAGVHSDVITTLRERVTNEGFIFDNSFKKG